jgi:hypothetical protein
MIVALISGLCVAVPTIIATVAANNKSQAILEYRIKELDEKVHEHNNLIDRMYKIENRVTLLEESKKEK